MSASNDKKLEKVLAKEEKTENKHIKEAIKEVAHAEKAETKAAKDENKAQKTHAKVAKEEHKLAEKLNAVIHNHEKALGEEQKAAKAIELKHHNHQKLEQEVAAKKAQLDQLQGKHAHNSELRDQKLHAPAPGANTVLPGSHIGQAPAVGVAPARAGFAPGPGQAPLAPAGGVATGTGHGLSGNTVI